MSAGTEQGDIPQCLSRLLDRLGETIDSLAEGHALGPYQLQALLDDVEFCPVICGCPDPAVRSSLETAISMARSAARIAAKCPSLDRTWVAQRLTAATDDLHQGLSRCGDDARLATAHTSDGKLRLGERCRRCPFA